MLFEKIFQRDDKSFLLFYRLSLSIVLYLSSTLAYFIRNKSWELSDIYIKAAITIVVVFLILSFFKSRQQRYIKGTVQWLRVELLLLIQTFSLSILLTVMLKTTDDYSRIWLFTNMGVSFVLFLIFKELTFESSEYFFCKLIISLNSLPLKCLK